MITTKHCKHSKLFSSNNLPQFNFVINQSRNMAKDSFLKHKALPNILVFFVGVPDEHKQQSLISKIGKLVDRIYGIDHYVVYAINNDDLACDSRCFSASALLVIHDGSVKNSDNISKLPEIKLPLTRLSPGESDQIDETYFCEQIKNCISKESKENDENEPLKDSPIYLFDLKRNFHDWTKMDNKTNIIQLHDNQQVETISNDTVIFMEWNRNRLSLANFGIDFDPVLFFNSLQTKLLGHTVLFANKIGTTMDLANRFRHVNGLIAVANYQTKGQGRNANRWLSPKGCAMFTLSLQLPINSPIVEHLPFIQHIVSLSIVLSLPKDKLNIKIKWPNDILFGDSMSKLAGILTQSFFYGEYINLQIGIGINKANRYPSACLDDVIEEYNNCLPPYNECERLKPISREGLIASFLNNFESFINRLVEQPNQLHEIKKLYINNWIHTDSIVNVHSKKSGSVTKVRICGINDNGYLLGQEIDGDSLICLTTEGNRFDLMENLTTINFQN